MEVALAGTNHDPEPDQAASGKAELGPIGPGHAAVEDDTGVRAAIVLTNEVDDRVAADLFLPVAGDPQVDGQRPLLLKQLRGLQ